MVSCISGAYQSNHVKHDQILNIFQAMYIFAEILSPNIKIQLM